jgi:uncharacterized protein (TIGR03437 family)
MNGTAWQSIGSAPAQNPYLSSYGGLAVAEVNSSDQYVMPSGVLFGNVQLAQGADADLYYTDFVSGTGTFNFGSSTCGPYGATPGVYSTPRCKFGPSIYYVDPLLARPDMVVQSGGSITITGVGFGAQRCGGCRVTASNPQPTTLQVSSWSDSSITAFLPASFTGIAQIGVTAATGFDAINILAAPATPSIVLSSTQLRFSYVMGGASPPAQTVAVSSSGGAFNWSASGSASWITPSTAAGVVTVSVNPANLSAGQYAGSIAINAAGTSNSPQTISVTLTVTAPTSTVAVISVTNAASGASGAIAPGEIVTIKGSGLGPAAGVSFAVDQSTGMVDTTLAGSKVFFGSFAAPITYASATQVNAIVPYEIAGQTSVVMQVQYQGAQSAGLGLQVASSAPGVFTFNSTGSGQAAAANQDGTFNGPSSPAAKGSYVTIYFTGGGETNPLGVTGSVAGPALKWLTQNISVTVGGVPAIVQFDGAAPGFVDGVGQLNIQLGTGTPSGPTQPLAVTVAGIKSPTTATLAVQ